MNIKLNKKIIFIILLFVIIPSVYAFSLLDLLTGRATENNCGQFGNRLECEDNNCLWEHEINNCRKFTQEENEAIEATKREVQEKFGKYMVCKEGWICDQGAFPLYHNSYKYYKLANCDMRAGSSANCFYGCLGTECAPPTNLCGNNICDINPETYKIGDIEKDCPQDCVTDCWGCIDSDNGKDYYKKGTVTFIKKPYPSSLNGKDDQCRGSKIEEWYCENGCPKNELHDCPRSCLNDACFTETKCGDNICEGEETYENCPLDCKEEIKPSCNDGIQNQYETRVDCGGPCKLCSDKINDLANYPYPFVVNGVSNKIAIVLGDDSPSSDVIASDYVSLGLQQFVGVHYKASNMLVSEVNTPQNYNLILIGNPCENSLIETIGKEKCSEWNLPRGNAIIKLVPNRENTALIIAGNEGIDRRRAAKFISNYKDYDLNGDKIILDTSSDDVKIKTTQLKLTFATIKDIYLINEKVKLTDPLFPKEDKIVEPLKLNSQEEIISDTEESPFTWEGYIIQFEEEPIIVKKTELDKEKEENQGGGLFKRAISIDTDEEVKNGLKKYIKIIDKEHKDVKSKIFEKINEEQTTGNIVGKVIARLAGKVIFNKKVVYTKNIEILGEYKTAFNGIALDISNQQAKEIEKIKGVKKVYPNYEVKAFLMDSIPLINADDVWKLDQESDSCAGTGRDCLTGKGITIAIIDTGIDYTHPDLGGCFGNGCKVIGGYDFVNHDNDPTDDNGHGTHVAGIVAGNGVLKGVAPDAKLYAYKVLGENGGGYDSNFIAALERAVDPNQDGNFDDHVDIISVSLGGRGNPDDAQNHAVDNVVEAGVVVVIAAGNSGPYERTIESPGTARKAITVGASDKNDKIAEFSSRGPTSVGTIKPDIIATGVDICSAKSKILYPLEEYFLPYLCKDNNHLKFSGTSMATPMVAGAVALLKQKNPNWSPEEIKYTLRETAIDIDEDITVQGYGRIDILKAVQLVNPLPITKLETYGEIRGAINILGEIKSNNFYNYKLEYGMGVSPSDWKEIANSLENPSNNILVNNFDTRILKENEIYRLRLIVTDIYGGTSEDNSLIISNNGYISFPGGNNPKKYFSAEEYVKNSYITDKIIEIKGNVMGEDLQNYVLMYASEENPNNWESNGIILKNNGQEQIIDDVLATLDTSFLNNGKYKLKLIVNYKSEQVEETVDIIIQKDQRENWPIMLGSRVTAADIDFDSPGKEIVVGVFPGWVEVRHSDGSLVEGWPQRTIKPTQAYPSVGDIDGNNVPEIIIGAGVAGGEDVDYASKSRVYAWHSDGTNVNGWPRIVDGFIPTIALADIDNDNINEIIASSGNKIYVWNSDGTNVNGWPKELDSEIMTTAAIGDINKDGNKELVVATHDNNIHIFKNDGNNLNNWPKKIGRSYSKSSPALADINNDDYLEIIIAVNDDVEGDPFGEIYVFNFDGSVVNGWPQKTGSYIQSSPAIGNLDFNYKGLEIVVSSWDSTGKVYAWHSDGTNVNGWPKSVENCRYNIESSPIIGDVTSDGKSEVIIGCSFDNKLYAYNSNANLVEGWPKITLGRIMGLTPSLSDMDEDGNIEILIGDNTFGFTYIWNLEETFSPPYIEWGMFHNNIQHTGIYLSPLPKSQIINYGNSDISGFLTIKVQKYIGGNWLDEKIIVNEISKSIIRGGNLALDKIWDENIGYIASEKGTFRVSIEFKTDKDSIQGNYEFKVL